MKKKEIINISRLKVSAEKNKFKKFVLQEFAFLRDLEWFVSDHAITTKRKIQTRKRKIQKLFERLK